MTQADQSIKETVKSIYGSLIGIASKLPESGTFNYDHGELAFFQGFIDELSSVTKKDYRQFIPSSKRTKDDITYYGQDYNQKVMALLNSMREEYLPEVSPPFSGSPSVVNSLTSNQQVNVSIVLEFQSLIDKKIFSGGLTPEEKGFLEKVKESLSTIRSVSELITLILTTAGSFRIGMEKLISIFT